MIKNILLLVLSCCLAACSSMKVAQLDPNTGRFPTKTTATVIKSEKVDLDSFKSLLLLPDNDFVKGQIANVKYFDKTMTRDDLETLVITNNLTDKVPSVRDKIGINKAYHAYKPFLWLRFETREDNGKTYGQFVLTKPDTLEDIFIVEKHFDYVWAGVNDQNTWYPMFNAIVDYIDENSNTWSFK
ncbi:hypothetical protein [Rheinheimera sp.]|uniref:hypothetical protein n=1 Tax=Rheinheimera sp. TaxID=1869214 RepID=UPI0027359A8A|nr:hypothetical protein [Rheinheimera sp.]MDP2713713.1 hypothetical protein [Rheinheimera sp.]